MKDMSIIANKKIINKETNEVRLVVSIDEENRKIHSVPVDEPNAEPSIMAAASYDRRWKLYEEPETIGEAVNEPAETEVYHDEPMKMSDVVTKLESLFDILNRVYFDNALPKPVICAVNGVAAGAGATLALGCDIVPAARSAKFVMAFSKLGLVPDCGGSWFLPRVAGRARAMGLALLGDSLSAEQAAQWGIIWQLVDDSELADTSLQLARHLAALPAFGLGLV